MKSAGKARSNGLYRHIRTSKEIIRNLLNDSMPHFHQIPLIERKQPQTANSGNNMFLNTVPIIIIGIRRK